MMDDLLATGVPTSIPFWDLAIRLAIALLFGAALGLDREIRHKPAGLRTHILVAIGAASFALITLEIYYQSLARPGSSPPDMLRVMQGIITGVAFLGAGSIIRGGGQVEGITTGASIWLTGAIGLACGTGFYAIAFLGTLFGIAALSILGWIASRVESDGKSAKAPHAPAEEHDTAGR